MEVERHRAGEKVERILINCTETYCTPKILANLRDAISKSESFSHGLSDKDFQTHHAKHDHLHGRPLLA